MRLVVIATVLLLATRAEAAPTLIIDERGPKDPNVAGLLSFTAGFVPSIAVIAALASDRLEDHETAIGVAVLSTVALGPLAGHWYAGTLITPATGIRALGIGVAVAAVVGDSYGLLAAGTAVMFGAAIYDVATAGRSARRYNHAHSIRRLQLQPVISPTSTRLSIGLVGRF